MSHEPKADWFAMSTRFLKDRKVQAMIGKHGTDVGTVAIALFGHARLMRQGGSVEITYRDLAHESFSDEQTVRAILETGHEQGFLVLDEQDDLGVELHFPAWERHQNTARQAESRARRKANSQANVTDSHEQSQNVTHITRQDKTEQDNTGEEKNIAVAGAGPLSKLLAELVTANDPDGKPTVPSKTWLVEEERLLRIDKRDPQKAANLIRWCQSDSFWRQNIRSMKTFRKQYPKLYMAAVEDHTRNKPRQSPGAARAEELKRRAQSDVIDSTATEVTA